MSQTRLESIEWISDVDCCTLDSLDFEDKSLADRRGGDLDGVLCSQLMSGRSLSCRCRRQLMETIGEVNIGMNDDAAPGGPMQIGIGKIVGTTDGPLHEIPASEECEIMVGTGTGFDWGSKRTFLSAECVE